MTMLPKTRRRARRLRSGVLTLTLAAFAPLAIPATASASTIPGYPPPGAFLGSPLGNEFLNQVNANSYRDQKTVFKMKFGLGVGAGPFVTAVNRAVALTSRCANCTAIAIGFQVVTTTDQDLVDLRAINVAKATNNDCTATCEAVADAYQVVVATDTPRPLTFGQMLSQSQLNALYQIRSEFLALQNSGLSLSDIEAKCQDLASQAVSILQDASDGGPTSGGPSYTTFTRPTATPAVHGTDAGTEPSGNGRPVVDLYHDFQFRPFSGR
jgi:hypothetical protein